MNTEAKTVTIRAARANNPIARREVSDDVGSYSPEQYPEDPEAATPPLDSGRASEPPKSG